MLTNIGWGPLHVHWRYSTKDALGNGKAMVATGKRNGYELMGLTDHGTTAGIYELYTECHKREIIPVPGIELYTTYDRDYAKRPPNWHMCVFATDKKGWDNLIGLSNEANRLFKYKPILDMSDLQRMSAQGRLKGLWATTGCLGGVGPQALRACKDEEANYRLAKNLIGFLVRCFDGRVLVELMNHGIVDEARDIDDDDVVADLDLLADEMGLPVVITPDSHYALKEHEKDHKTLKKLTSWNDNDPDSSVFDGDGYWLPTIPEMQARFSPELWAAGLEGINHMMRSYDLVVPELDDFVVKMPRLRSVVSSPEHDLEARVKEARVTTQSERDRLVHELDVINSSGFAPYIMLTAEVTDFCNEKDIRFITRGSASGSLVCKRAGITQVDPLKWDLRFDRFLTRDRSKPPDIDLDVEQGRRQEVVDYLSESYAVRHIGTWGELGINPEEDSAGSLWVMRKIYERKTGIDPDRSVRPDIESLARHGAYSGIGKHAAGLLIAQDESVLTRIPQSWIASSKTMVTSLDKDVLEAAGYVKIDILGSATLTAVKEIERTTGIRMEQIPEIDQATMKMIRKGRTEGVFQLSGWSQRKGLPRLQPKTLEDIIVSLALFRPAIMEIGAVEEYLAVRRGGMRMPFHSLIEKHVAVTNGIVLFQEQVIGILRDLGMSPEELGSALKAVKASNASIDDAAEVMAVMRETILPLTQDAGFSDRDTKMLQTAMQGYSAYGFNRAHAVSYGLLAWRTAWYKANTPVEFWAAMLAVYAKTKREEAFRKECEKDNVLLLPPNVNASKSSYSIDDKYHAVRSGLTVIDGIGDKTANEVVANQPYSSLMDFAKKVSPSKVKGARSMLAGHTPESCGGTVLSLFKAGAMRGLENDMVQQEVLA